MLLHINILMKLNRGALFLYLAKKWKKRKKKKEEKKGIKKNP